jgi:hypothetical protein
MCAVLLCRHRARYRKFTDARSKKRYALLHRISPVQRVQKLGISIDPEGRTIWIADPHRGDDVQRFVVRADEKLTPFVELEKVTRESIYGYDAGRYPLGPTVIIE